MSLGLKKKKRRKGSFLAALESRTYVLLALTLAALGYLIFLAGTATRSADDFWYASFFRGTPAEFFALTREHYMTFNGRALIHMVAQFILYKGNGAFAVLMFLLMGAAPYLTEEGERTWAQRLGAMLIFYLGVALLPLEMIRQGLTWISAFCNYVLPTVMVFFQVKLLFRFAEKGGVGLGFLCALQSLLCGATTEQSGVVALCVALFSVFYCIPKGWKRSLACLGCTLCALGGLATIFASPATRERTEAEIKGLEALGGRILLGLKDQSGLFFRHIEILLLGALLAALVLLLARQEGKNKLCWAATGCGALYLIAIISAWLVPEGKLWAYLVCLCLMCPCALLLWMLGRRQWGALLLCGLASLLVILPTRSNAPRTVLPALLYLLAVVSQLAGELIPWKGKTWWFYPAFFGVSLCLVYPQIPNYWQNHRVEILNRAYVEAARETGVLYHCMDYVEDYTHTKAHMDGFTYANFLDTEGFTVGEDEIYFYGTGLPKVYVNGRRAISPALKGEGGNWLLPLRDIVEGLGGFVRVDYSYDHEFYVELGDYQCCLDGCGPGAMQFRSRISTAEVTRAWRRGVAERAAKYFCTCLSEFFYTDYLGLEVEFREDGEGGAFYVTLPEPETEGTTNGTA